NTHQRVSKLVKTVCTYNGLFASSIASISFSKPTDREKNANKYFQSLRRHHLVVAYYTFQNS
ncbi:hypothetical protein OEZ83_26520, partial [Leclercia adecarboxylata]|uniref:hypothetical protein n=1 Tax=Leclercia adecarboxylata TaxID=83655 RepID=UPI00234D52E5